MVMRGFDRVGAWLIIGLSVWCGGRVNLLAADQRPNILLVVADDLGYSDLGCYGGEMETPILDGLAGEGLRLTRFYNTGRCCPSRASILTGQYPHRVGLGHMTQDLGRPGYRGRLAPNAKTIADYLQGAGYRCFLAGKWHLGTPDPTRHGFEQFYGTLVSAKTFWDPDHLIRLPLPDDSNRSLTETSETRGDFYATDAVTDRAIEFLSLADQTPDQPWFLYLAFHAPHFPLQARQEEIDRCVDRYRVGWDVIRRQRLQRMKRLGIVDAQTELSARSEFSNYGQTQQGVNPPWQQVPPERQGDLTRRMAIYAAMVHSMDANLGRLMQRLEETGQRESTLVVFLSDNGACAEWDPWGFDGKSGPDNVLHRGEELKQMGGPGTFHSVGSGWANASNTPWRLYKHFNHEGGISAPCILSWPGRSGRAGQIDETPAHVIDLVPTILQAASLNPPGGAALAGESLLPLLRGGELPDRMLFFEHEGNRAVTDGRWKLVAIRDQHWELYDLSVDRTETNDLSARYPERVASLSKAWQTWAEANQVTPLPSNYQVEYLRVTR